MQNTEYADFNWEKCTQHVQPKAWRKFRLKGKSKKKSAKDRFIPIPAKLVWKIKERMRQRNAQPHDLCFLTAKANLTVTSYASSRQLPRRLVLKAQSFTASAKLTQILSTRRAST